MTFGGGLYRTDVTRIREGKVVLTIKPRRLRDWCLQRSRVRGGETNVLSRLDEDWVYATSV